MVYAVDRRTSDGTRHLIRKYGFPFIEVEGDEPRVEALLPSIAAQVAAPWILRLDDDELPTQSLLDFAAAASAGGSEAAYTFNCASLRCNPVTGRLERSYFFAFERDRHLRLYKPKSVTYQSELHTPGLIPSVEKQAPPDAYLLHFDWVLRSKQAREVKFKRYEKQSPRSAENNKITTLYEIVPDAWHNFAEVKDETLQNFARQLRNLV